MGQFTPGYQPGFTNYTQNDGFSAGSGETPLGSGNSQPSTSGFNGASLVQTNGNPLGGVYGQPGQFGNPAAPPPQNQSQFGKPGWKPSYNAPGGYNPLQYADDNTANTLAQGLGGTVERTKTLGPFGDFGQNQISFGNGNQLNAGLLADRYSKYDAATSNAMTDAERNAGPAVKDPNAGAVYLTGNPMINPSQTPGYHPPTAPTVNSPAQNPTPNPLTTNPITNPQVAAPPYQYSSGMGGMGDTSGGNGQNQLMQLLQLLGMSGQSQAQNRQPYANSGYYPNLPRMNQGLLNPTTGQGSGGQQPRYGNSNSETYRDPNDPRYQNLINPTSSGPAGINPLSSDWRNTPEQIALNAYVQSRGPNPYQPAGYDPNAMQSQEVKPWQQKWNDELKQDPEYMRLYNAATPQNGMLPYQRPSVSTPTYNGTPGRVSPGLSPADRQEWQNTQASLARLTPWTPQQLTQAQQGGGNQMAMNGDLQSQLNPANSQGQGLAQGNIQRQLLSLLLGF